ncbi:MAG TPA: DUF4383 domain-containing protein [Nitrospira sp.]|nr:DUF4383 domain-containing protein [Nitrospira sp.]
MTNRQFASLAGAVYLVIGGLGALVYVFPIGAFDQTLHLAVGIWGVTAASSVATALSFARKTAVLFAAVAVLELAPIVRSQFDGWLLPGPLLPLLHLLTAWGAGYYGYYWTDAVAEGQGERAEELRKAA